MIIIIGFMVFATLIMIDFTVRLSWGIVKALISFMIMPGLLIGLVVLGLIKFGLPILLLAGGVMICRKVFY